MRAGPDRGIQECRVRLLPTTKVYCLKNFLFVNTPPSLVSDIFVAYRKIERANSLVGHFARDTPWPYWWTYTPEGGVYRLDASSVEVVENVGLLTEVELIARHHPILL